MAAMKNFLIYIFFTTYLMQNWVVSLTHLLLSNISDISHCRSIHSAVGSRTVCPLRQSDLDSDSDNIALIWWPVKVNGFPVPIVPLKSFQIDWLVIKHYERHISYFLHEHGVTVSRTRFAFQNPVCSRTPWQVLATRIDAWRTKCNVCKNCAVCRILRLMNKIDRRKDILDLC